MRRFQLPLLFFLIRSSPIHTGLLLSAKLYMVFFFFTHSPLEPCFRDSSHELVWTCLAGAQNSRKSSPSQAVSCCHHKVFTHQEPPTSFPTYWSSDQNKCHVWAGMGPGLSASDDLPWKEALGLSLHWQMCRHQLGGSRKTGSWGAGERLQGQGELVVGENGVCRVELGEAPGPCRKCCWLSIQPQSPPTFLEGRASCRLPHRRVSLLWGGQT